MLPLKLTDEKIKSSEDRRGSFLSKYKFTLEEKLRILAWIDEGHRVKDAVTKFNVTKSTIRRWRIKLEAHGIEALTKQPSNMRYPTKLKIKTVESYLAGEGSQDDICRKYGIRNRIQLQNWILKYTQGETLKTSPGGKSRAMSKSRKTTYEERLEIVQYCISLDNNYQATAERYQVSYQQVYSWIRKYNDGGEKALVDRRGKAKEETELTEIDRLKIEVRKLQKANYRLELENEFLKKLEELEKRYR
jgi:transposase